VTVVLVAAKYWSFRLIERKVRMNKRWIHSSGEEDSGNAPRKAMENNIKRVFGDYFL
jgi:hypothetical protein